MVKSPCCQKAGLKKGPWTPEEDQKLLAYIEEHGHRSWQALPAKAGLQRCGKSCRLRWTNYLRPDIKRGKFSLQEEQTIIQLHAFVGNKWSAIAAHLPKRTDNEIKNYWNTHLKKRLDKMGIDPATHQPKADAFGSHRGNLAELRHMAQWESARLEAEARLARDSIQLLFNPFQKQISAATHQKLSAITPPARPPCLDVLKAWQNLISSNQLESPTSTLNFSQNSVVLGNIPISSGFNEFDDPQQVITMKGLYGEIEELKKQNEIIGAAVAPPPNGWVEAGNEMGEGVCDEMLIYESNNRNGSAMEGAVTETENSYNISATGSYDEDDINYWNTLLNWVGGGPSYSPTF